MWAQLIKARIKPGREDDARQVADEFQAHVRATGIGPTHVLTMQNQKDPQEQYTLAIFESEEKARENESNPQSAELIRKFWEVYEGQPEYTDLDPFSEWSR